MGKPYGGDRRLGRTVTHGLATIFCAKAHAHWAISSLYALE